MNDPAKSPNFGTSLRSFFYFCFYYTFMLKVSLCERALPWNHKVNRIYVHYYTAHNNKYTNWLIKYCKNVKIIWAFGLLFRKVFFFLFSTFFLLARNNKKLHEHLDIIFCGYLMRNRHKNNIFIKCQSKWFLVDIIFILQHAFSVHSMLSNMRFWLHIIL